VQTDAIMQTITERTRDKAREGYGINVRAVRLKRLNFPEENRQAVFRRMEAERERIARQYRSEGEEEAEKVRAQADLEQARILADADRQSGEVRGEADAEAARIYAAAYSRDPAFYEFLKISTPREVHRRRATIVLPSDSRLLRLLREPPATGAEGLCRAPGRSWRRATVLVALAGHAGRAAGGQWV
jgi:membrane protease subunit HflC